MAEFLQSYGIYIALGLLALIMLVRRGQGGGCCGGGHDHGPGSAVSDKENQQSRSSGCH